jgi:2,3-bisphosphoglycerate-independent phosphoglycerate mutase
MSVPASANQPPVCLLVLDGWGYREDPANNAVAAAGTPNFDSLWETYPHTLLEASGRAVGLPDGQMGNSEVGHTTIGAGMAVETDLVRISEASKGDEFINNPALSGAFEQVVKHDSTLHVMGLIGTGGVHAHDEHMQALLAAAQKAGVRHVAVHAFTDGRDSGTQEAAGHMRGLEKQLKQLGIGRIASVSGRYFAMDRDKNYDRLAKAEAVIIDGKGPDGNTDSAAQFLENAYREGLTDELFKPHVFTDEQGETQSMSTGDAVIFMNFRADRAIQLSEVIAQKPGIYFATLTDYGPSVEAHVAFPAVNIETTLAAEIDRAGFTQAHAAESEKGPHATYFLNGKRRTPYPLERHIILKSYTSEDGVDTHDQRPEMRAAAVGSATIQQIEGGRDFIFTNIANPDMVGHTGNVPAIIRAVETTDRQLGLIADVMLARGGVLLVTADHGNAEVNVTPEGEPHTAHTTNPVPFIAVSDRMKLKLRPEGALSGITPTVLSIMDIAQPLSMTGDRLNMVRAGRR